MVRAGLLDGDPWVHEAGVPFAWVAYIHPPLYSAFLASFEWAYQRWGIWPGWLLYAFSAVAVAVLAVVSGLVVRLGGGKGAAAFGALAAGWTVLSASNLRPFEQYPPARLLVGFALLGLLHHARTGRAFSLWAAAVTTLVAGELHLNCWFSLGPLWVLAAWAEKGRRAAVLGAFAVVCVLFAASTWPGLFDVLAEGPGHPEGWERPLSMRALTMEWSNAWLLVPTLLWWTPLAAGRDPMGRAVALAAWVATATVFVLQFTGLCIGGDFFSAHHYFELVDPLLVAGAALALRAAWEGRSGTCCTGVILGLSALVTFHQLEILVRGLDWLAQLARERAGP